MKLKTAPVRPSSTGLDRDTSGVVLVAKHTAAARELGMIFERREAAKEYLAIVSGWPERGRLGVCRADPARRGNRPVVDLGAPDRASSGPGLPHAVPGGTPVRTGGGEICLDPLFSGNRPHAPNPRPSGALPDIPIVGDKLYSGDGAEYLEWMATGWTPELQATLAPAPSRAPCRPARAAMGRATHRLGSRTGRRSGRFSPAGKSVVETPGVVIWSRHD